MAKGPTIGKLRWQVQIAKRAQAADTGVSILEDLQNVLEVNADIQPLGPMTYLEGVQTDRPITHRVYIRWLDWVDETHVLIRQSTRLDDSNRVEIFRIRKAAEFEGRKRYLELLVELERRA